MSSKVSYAAWRERTMPVNPTLPGTQFASHTMRLEGVHERKLPMKRVIAEDCSEENQNRKKLLCCLEGPSKGFPGISQPKAVGKAVVRSGSQNAKPPPAKTETVEAGNESEVPERRNLRSSKVYGCKFCEAELCTHDDILSRNFRGQHGKAYLFDSVNLSNVIEHKSQERNMTTGWHMIADISCRQCNEILGWKYNDAREASEKYKIGKHVLEAELLKVL